MKPDDELGPDRGFFFETDDEENQAERDTNEDYESDFTLSSHEPSGYNFDSRYNAWPQSYRESMNLYTSVTPPGVGFIAGSNLAGISNSFFSSSSSSSSIHKRQTSEFDPSNSLSKPLISTQSADKDKLPFLKLPSKPTIVAASSQNLSYIQRSSRQCSYAQSVLNGVNVLCGVGLLSTPLAIKEGGWGSLFFLFFFGIISCYTGVLLKRCLESSPGLHTYPDIGQAAFGKVGRLSIAIVLYVELYACSVEFITLISDNVASSFPNAHLNFSWIDLDSHHLFAILGTIVVLPTVWLRNLSLLSYLSAGGVVGSLLVVLCLLWVGLVDRIGFHPSGTAFNLPNLPVAIGLYGFCYAGHSVFPNIYSSMKTPSQFPSVLMVSFAICWFLYTGVAICGFLMFGESIESQFTLNLPKKLVASKIAIWTTILNPLTKYALTITPVALSLEELLPSVKHQSHCIAVCIRTILVLSTLVVALTIPFFGFVMALIGSFLTILTAFILPCACYLSILRGRLSWLQIAICVFIIIVGVGCACVGTYSAASRIVENMG